MEKGNATKTNPKTRISQLEKELEETRHELNHSFDAAIHGIRIINKDFTIRRINRAFARMTGANQSKSNGKKCWDIFPGPFCHTPDCRLTRIVDGEEQIQAKIERVRTDGSTIPCKVITTAIRNASGEVTGIIEQFYDISENLWLKEKAKESEEFSNALIKLGGDTSEAIVILQDIDGREAVQTFVNDEWLRITGYSNEELLGKSFIELLIPKDREVARARHHLGISGKSLSGLYEVYVVRKDGSTIQIEVTGALTTYQGKTANVLYIRDVSERKKIENKLQIEENRLSKLIECAPIAIIEIDFSATSALVDNLRTKGIRDFYQYFIEHPETLCKFNTSPRVISMNQAALGDYISEILQVQDVYEAISEKGLNSAEICEEDKLCFKGLARLYSQLFEGSKTSVQEYPRPAHNGEYKYVRTYMNALPGHETDLSWVVVVEVDITDKVSIENKLKRYQQHLEEIVRERTLDLEASFKREHELSQKLAFTVKQQVEFIRRLVHDLKTPLFPILSVSEMLLGQAENTNTRQLALNINRGAKKLNSSINDLLDVMRGEIGILQLERVKHDIAELVSESVQFFAYEAQKKSQTLTLDINGKIPQAWVDHQRLTQVVMNLLENALRHSPSSGSISVRLEKRLKNIIIEIIDSGPGIQQEDLPFIFEPYYSKNKRSKPSGLGLGLPLAKMLVELHGGEIWAKNQPGGGANIGFSVPIVSKPVVSKPARRSTT